MRRAITSGRPTRMGPGESFVNGDLDRTQHPQIFGFGIDDPLWIVPRLREERPHEDPGVIHVLRQLPAISLEVGDRPRRDPALHRRARHGGRDALDEARIERARNQILGSEAFRAITIGVGDDLRLLGLGEPCDSVYRCDLHLRGDAGGAHIERAAENEGKTENVVDLVRVVGSTRRDDRVGSHRLGKLGEDLRFRVGERQDERPVGHARNHFRLQHAARGKAQKDVRTLDNFSQRAGTGFPRITRLVFVHEDGAPDVDHTFDVGHRDVLDRQAETHEQIETGKCCCARSGRNESDLRQLLADHL